MGPGAAAVANLFFLVLATAFFSAAAQASYDSMAKPSTVWINNAASFNFIRPNSFLLVRPIVIHILQDDSGLKSAFGAGFVCVYTPTRASAMFFFAVFYFTFYDDPYKPFIYLSDLQVTWSANRDHPVKENATLEFTSDGNLVLRDADDSHVWSSNSSGRSVAGMTITEMGNLVLFDHRNATVWQSFEHPTDTMVLGQSLVEGMSLTANTSTTNTTGSKFYITVRPDGLYGYVESTPPQLYFSYTSTDNITNYPIKITFMNGSINVLLQSTIQNDDNSVPLPATNSSQYMRIESDGHLRLYGDNGTKLGDVMLIDDCDYPTACGEYGICNGGQCTCPVDDNSSSNYFKLVDERKPNLGCTPITSISCQQIQQHQLLTMADISYFDKNATVLNALSIDDCQQACLKNCSCMAVMFRYHLVGVSECIWLTKIFSLQSLQPGNYYINSTAYLKVQTSPFKKNKKKVMVGVTLGSITTLVLLVIVVILYLQKRRNNEAEGEELDFDQLPGMPTRFSFQTLRECTEGFSTKLGEGGFGSVFEGKLGEERVAVKRLEGARQGKKEFLAEVETIGSIEHINLVSLIGFCAEKTERLLVYEYMSRGSLDRWIYYRHNNGPLDWCTRSRIILDIAKGLCYLHEECKRKIAHLDIKPQNILLDDNFNAKVADFGLCKLINRDQSKVVTVMRGTPGYLAPEWLTSRITEKVDVYSFGVVVMEIVSGRKNIDHSQSEEEVQLINVLREKAQNDQLVDLVDKHSDDMVSHQEEVIQMMKLAIWCLQNESIQRPSMSVVIKVLEGSMSVETFDANSVMPIQHNASTSSVPPQASVLSGPR